MRESEYVRGQHTHQVDFLLDEEDFIILNPANPHFGFSVPPSVERLRMALGDVPDELIWTLDVGTPFPSQLNLQLTPDGSHASINTTIRRVNRQKLENILKCLPWKKIAPTRRGNGRGQSGRGRGPRGR